MLRHYGIKEDVVFAVKDKMCYGDLLRLGGNAEAGQRSKACCANIESR